MTDKRNYQPCLRRLSGHERNVEAELFGPGAESIKPWLGFTALPPPYDRFGSTDARGEIGLTQAQGKPALA